MISRLERPWGVIIPSDEANPDSNHSGSNLLASQPSRPTADWRLADGGGWVCRSGLIPSLRATESFGGGESAVEERHVQDGELHSPLDPFGA